MCIYFFLSPKIQKKVNIEGNCYVCFEISSYPQIKTLESTDSEVDLYYFFGIFGFSCRSIDFLDKCPCLFGFVLIMIYNLKDLNKRNKSILKTVIKCLTGIRIWRNHLKIKNKCFRWTYWIFFKFQYVGNLMTYCFVSNTLNFLSQYLILCLINIEFLFSTLAPFFSILNFCLVYILDSLKIYCILYQYNKKYLSYQSIETKMCENVQRLSIFHFLCQIEIKFAEQQTNKIYRKCYTK